MPVKRNADGSIIEEKTRTGETFQQGTPAIPGQFSAGDTVGPGTGRTSASAQQFGYDARTVLAGAARGTARRQNKDPKTRVYRPGRTQRGEPTAAAPGAGTQGEPSSAMDGPSVGWLVVIKGQGQGRFVALGNGSNSVGWDESERVRIDFGDEAISRRGHSTITYDHGVGRGTQRPALAWCGAGSSIGGIDGGGWRDRGRASGFRRPGAAGVGEER